MKTSTLKPGLLVSLKTTIKGGVHYARVDIEPEHETETGSVRAKWETEKTIQDPEEYERATSVRGKCRSVIGAACVWSSFGLLCPSESEPELDAAIVEARRLAREFNLTAKRCRVSVYVMAGRVASTDEEAARAISAEVVELMESMKAGVASADVKAIREAATKAKALGGMLTDDAAGKVSEAIRQARSAAREIVKRVEKAGEAAADVVKELQVERIESARFAFLDIDDQEREQREPEAPAARGIDLAPAEPEPEPEPMSYTEQMRQLDREQLARDEQAPPELRQEQRERDEAPQPQRRRIGTASRDLDLFDTE